MTTVRKWLFGRVWYYFHCQSIILINKMDSNLELVSIKALEHVVKKESRVRETLQRWLQAVLESGFLTLQR